MLNFKQHNQLFVEFFNTVEGAVKHIDHLEENIITGGYDGVVNALTYIDNAIKYFANDTNYKISTKFDGSPAIVAGLDNQGKFFVATKSAFAKNPKLNYTVDDINRHYADQPGLAAKLNNVLTYLPSLGLKGIYQMDYMFDNDLKHVETPTTIDGIENFNNFITFKPNTIKYAVHPHSVYGKDILKSNLGVAIHIEYEVKNGILGVKKYTSSSTEFTPSKDVFVFNVLIDKPEKPAQTLLKMLVKDVDSKRKKILKWVKDIEFEKIANYGAELKMYINTEIKNGKFLDNSLVSTYEFINYILERKYNELNKLKSESGKQRKEQQIKSTQKDLKQLKKSIKLIFEITKSIANLKNSLIKVFNEITKHSYLRTYFETTPGEWTTTEPEGYAISKIDNGTSTISKLVNRSKFSAQNFAKQT